MGVTSPDISRPIFDIPPDSWLNSLGAYNTWAGGDSFLDLPRTIVRSGKYYFMGTAFPTGANSVIAARASFSGAVTLAPYSYLVSITQYSNQEEGFKFSVYDKGARSQLFQQTFAWAGTAAGSLPQQYPGGFANPSPIGPYILTSPLIVMPPGSLQIEITNLSANEAIIQVLLGYAVPLTPQTLHQTQITQG